MSFPSSDSSTRSGPRTLSFLRFSIFSLRPFSSAGSSKTPSSFIPARERIPPVVVEGNGKGSVDARAPGLGPNGFPSRTINGSCGSMSQISNALLLLWFCHFFHISKRLGNNQLVDELLDSHIYCDSLSVS